MKELSRFELATIKRTAKSVKSFRNKGAKLAAKIDELKAELETVNKVIEEFEAPIVKLTGGFTSEQVLGGQAYIEDGGILQIQSPSIEFDNIELNPIELNVVE